MLLIGPKNDEISIKLKGLLRNFNSFSGRNQVISKKKVFSEISSLYPAKIKLFACDFDRPFTSQCLLDGSPLEFMGPRVIVPPAPPLGGPANHNFPARLLALKATV